MKPCILVTGGHGFIGAWVLRELRRHDCRIVVLDLNPQLPAWARWPELTLADITVVPGELMTPNLLERTLEAHPISHVIHLIGLLTPACQQDPVRGAEVNVLGTLRLFELSTCQATKWKWMNSWTPWRKFDQAQSSIYRRADHRCQRPAKNNLTC